MYWIVKEVGSVRDEEREKMGGRRREGGFELTIFVTSEVLPFKEKRMKEKSSAGRVPIRPSIFSLTRSSFIGFLDVARGHDAAKGGSELAQLGLLPLRVDVHQESCDSAEKLSRSEYFGWLVEVDL